jgi:hypothetical protein
MQEPNRTCEKTLTALPSLITLRIEIEEPRSRNCNKLKEEPNRTWENAESELPNLAT